ncbi:MAG: internal scaffolding protein [Arizlama microvirus]|nr:MAG: internal scaffolding protein [Arizlama microvirus]
MSKIRNNLNEVSAASLEDSSYRDQSGHDVIIRANGSRRVSLSFENDPGLTVQNHKDSCDITNILAGHIRMGDMPPMPESVFTDLTNMPDYQTCLNTVMAIDDIFDNLPPKVKIAFEQNPAALMAAVEDPTQRDRLIELGVFTATDGHQTTMSEQVPAEKSDGAEGAR